MVNCGLVTKKNESVPLKSISVEVRVQDHVATVSSTLQYVNEEERPLEALFVFPLPADAAVCHFSAKIGEQEIVAEVQDRETARDRYDDAVSSGQQAFLLEESEECPDVFGLSVGCLSPGQSAAVTIIYVTELALQADHSLRFCLPAVLNPRYTPTGSAAGIVSEISSGCGSVPYTLTLSVHVSSPKPISKLESSCTLDPLVFLHSDHTQATVNLSPGHMFDKDVELFVFYQDTHQPSAIVEAGVTTAPSGSLMRDPVVMISLYPEFPEEVMSSLATKAEFIFLMDQSGSMECMMHHGKGAQTRNEQCCRDTLMLLLKSLPMGCYFNIYGFGSRFESSFTFDVEYNQKTMDQALRIVKRMQPDLGGTDILQPLKYIYSRPCYRAHPRQLFIFTDGEVFNTKEVLDLVKHHAHSHRCFSFGIGEGASTALITGMAREGSGHAQFITGTDRMQPKVMQSLRLAMQPAVVKISVSWTRPRGITVSILSPRVNVLFQGQRALIYAQLKGESSGGSEGTVTIKYSLKDQQVTNQLHFCLKPTEETGLAVHYLAARTLIRSLEQKEKLSGSDLFGIRSSIMEKMKRFRNRIVKTSIQTGVSSVYTAFIASNKDSRQTVKGPLLQTRVQTCGWFSDCKLVSITLITPGRPTGAPWHAGQTQPVQQHCKSWPREWKTWMTPPDGSILQAKLHRNCTLHLWDLHKSFGGPLRVVRVEGVPEQLWADKGAFHNLMEQGTAEQPDACGGLGKTSTSIHMLYSLQCHRGVGRRGWRATKVGFCQPARGLDRGIAEGTPSLSSGYMTHPRTLPQQKGSDRDCQPEPGNNHIQKRMGGMTFWKRGKIANIGCRKGSNCAELLLKTITADAPSHQTHRQELFQESEEEPCRGSGLDWDKKMALAFLLRPAHHNRFDTTHQYTILAVPTPAAPLPDRCLFYVLARRQITSPGLPFSFSADPFLQLVSLQKASGCWELDATLADVFGKTEDELTNQKPAQVDGSVWATLLALIWLCGCKIEQQVEWQFVAMKAASWIGSQKVGDLSQCVCVGNVLLGCQVTKEALGI
ncbi:von Willebrand factor A domain-containing protein 5A-like [Chanodichthys erythropterus]|uniref:von Willebrand factor A domain-containing protein 5A-like n=1 Tax=Chanodichthys erythropterus TaxID=933992 RepID=UPI00351EBA38